MWCSGYNSLNFKVHFFQVNMQSCQSHAEYSMITNQTFHNFFVNNPNVSVVNVICPLDI